MLGSFTRAVALCLVVAGTVATTHAETLSQTVKLPFDLRTPHKLDLVMGPVRVNGASITQEDRRLVDVVLPPRGGQTRFGWLKTLVQVQNQGKDAYDVRIGVKLLDAAGAVIDEFEFGGKSWLGKTREFTLTRLTLNYVMPLIQTVELTVTVET
ncbi:MAG: hypothetical protein U0V87_14340 [Acidobacteriota bacterium]